MVPNGEYGRGGPDTGLEHRRLLREPRFDSFTLRCCPRSEMDITQLYESWIEGSTPSEGARDRVVATMER